MALLRTFFIAVSACLRLVVGYGGAKWGKLERHGRNPVWR